MNTENTLLRAQARIAFAALELALKKLEEILPPPVHKDDVAVIDLLRFAYSQKPTNMTTSATHQTSGAVKQPAHLLNLVEIVQPEPQIVKPEPAKLITDSVKHNFEQLILAAKNDDLALVQTTRSMDGKNVLLVCVMDQTDTDYYPTPIAEWILENPFETYENPLD